MLVGGKKVWGSNSVGIPFPVSPLTTDRAWLGGRMGVGQAFTQ
jgi:hypothetical protein